MVIGRFPNHRNTIRRLYAEDGCFRSLCDCYRQCSEALRYWAQSDQEIAPERHHEYAGLLRELEWEIQQYQDGKSSEISF
jgi:hypothetical protein